MNSRVTKASPNKPATVVHTRSAWTHPELKPLDFNEFRSRLIDESGISIDSRKIYKLLLGCAGRKARGYAGLVCSGLLYWEFARFLEVEKKTYFPGLGLVDRSEFHAALCHHPVAVLRTIEYARGTLLEGSEIDDQSHQKFEKLERVWLAKATLEEPWFASYLQEDGCAASAFHARLRLFELLRGTPRAEHYLKLARDLCQQGDDGAMRAEILEEKLKELSENKSSSALVVCSRPFSEAADGSDREAHQLKRYAVLQRPVPFACLKRPMASIKAVLDAQYPWMANVTQHFMGQLQAQALHGNPRISLRPTLLVGEPGIGKNHYLNKLAQELQLPSLLISVGGSSDNRALVGTARGWGNGRPSQVLTAMVDHKVVNPLFILDEIEKEGTGNQNGRVTDTLHQLLEKGNARRWYDEFLLTECDLSWVNWIACANSLKGLPDSLLSRFEVVKVSRPSHEDMYSVVYGSIRDVAARCQQPLAMMPTLTPSCWELLEDCFKRGCSPRTVAKITERLVTAVMVSESSTLVH